MNGKAELLNFVYQNSQMGIDTISQIIEITEGKDFIKQLKKQLKEYESINKEAVSMLNKDGYDEKEISTFDKIKAYLMINIQTMTDKSPAHLAEMLITGSNMGVLDATKNLKKYSNADKKAIQLMDELLKIEEDNIQQLKDFL